MKRFLLLTFVPLLSLVSCTTTQQEPSPSTKVLEARIDSLEQRLAHTYKPGFGEFMSGIQVHHAKLWFAGQSRNWKLADFEVHEIMEALDDLKTFQPERKEVAQLPMLSPALDSINASIQRQDIEQFKRSFTQLTNTCNNCHAAVGYEFNHVKIPDTPPFSNQDFKPN